MLDERDPVALQVNRVQKERSGSLDVDELNENIEKLTNSLANINMAGLERRMGHVKCLSCGETGHIARRSNMQSVIYSYNLIVNSDYRQKFMTNNKYHTGNSKQPFLLS